jgi:SAM-dependent methyltransferase
MTALQSLESCHGVRQIVRFNWPYYAAGAAVVLPTPLIVPLLPGGAHVHAIVYAVIAVGAFWMVGSLGASWLIYDRSRLMTGDWIREALGYRPRTWLNIHAGLDELTPILRMRLPRSRGRVFDIFDAREMPEPSIGRARGTLVGTDSERVDFRHLPLPTGAMDTVFLLLSAHELRTHEARCALFREIHRVLKPDGCVLVAEHLRDAANVLAFGPGAWHFHSRATWTRGFVATAFGIYDEFSITPFIRVFVLRRLGDDHEP